MNQSFIIQTIFLLYIIIFHFNKLLYILISLPFLLILLQLLIKLISIEYTIYLLGILLCIYLLLIKLGFKPN